MSCRFDGKCIKQEHLLEFRHEEVGRWSRRLIEEFKRRQICHLPISNPSTRDILNNYRCSSINFLSGSLPRDVFCTPWSKRSSTLSLNDPFFVFTSPPYQIFVYGISLSCSKSFTRGKIFAFVEKLHRDQIRSL